MFRMKQKMPCVGYFPSVLPSVEVNEVQEVSVVYRDASKAELPDPEVTRLGEVLKAGVDLKRVNTKLFKPESVNLELGDSSAELPADKSETSNKE